VCERLWEVAARTHRATCHEAPLLLPPAPDAVGQFFAAAPTLLPPVAEPSRSYELAAAVSLSE
jgi:hypothetical protein